jgi:hypothetical protein
LKKNQFQKKKHWKKNLIHPRLTWLTHDPRYKDQIWFKNNEEKFITIKKLKKKKQNKTNSNQILRIKSDTKTKWKKIIWDKIKKNKLIKKMIKKNSNQKNKIKNRIQKLHQMKC